MKFFLILLLSIAYGVCEDITNQVFPSHLCCPAAFGHFNRDKLTDVFLINHEEDKYVTSVLLAFENPPLLRPTGPSCEFDKSIVSIVPADFDGDGDMDALVLVFDEKVYKGYILWGNSTTWKCPTRHSKPIRFASQPVLVDYNGDMIADLFGENEEKERLFWVFSSNRNEAPKEVKMHHSKNLTALSVSNGHSFVDLDDDGGADLWLTTPTHFEFWPSATGFKEFDVVALPKSSGDFYGQNIFADFDLDGEVELLVPVCTGDDCNLYIYEIKGKKHWYPLEINMTDIHGKKWKLRNTQSSLLYTNTLYPRIGDLNLDGFPDLLLTLYDSSGKPCVVVLDNVGCIGNCSYTRTFVPDWNMLPQYGDSVLGAFFDFNEDGALDILLVNTSSNGEKYSMSAFKNPIEYDATFLKVIVLTGRCYRNCSFGINAHGTNQPGPSLSYSIITATGEFQKSCSTQLSKSSHFSLQLPFTVFGLGRNWNFVDKLTVALPTYKNAVIGNITEPSSVYERTFLQIIPNSQVVVIPFPIWESNRWIHKLFITPSTAMILTAVSLILICFVVGCIIVACHYFERREDKKERLHEAQRFHFVAM